MSRKIWGLVDKRAMRLRTGDLAIDALTPAESGKAGKFLLVIAGVIVLHVVVSQLFFRGDGEGILNNGFLSPLFTAVRQIIHVFFTLWVRAVWYAAFDRA